MSNIVNITIKPKESTSLENIQKKIVSIQGNFTASLIEEISQYFSNKIMSSAPIFTSSLKRFATDCESSAIFIQNLPKFDFNEEHLKCAKMLAMSISFLLGEPFQYKQQNNAEIVAEIRPTKELANTHSSGGKIAFGWHTDDCFIKSRYRTKWIQLFGFYNPDNTLTDVALVDDIINHLDEKTLSILMLKRFEVKIPISFGLGEKWSDPIALLRINGDNAFEIGVPTYNVRPHDKNDSAALLAIEELKLAANKVRRSICVKAGTMLIFDNDRLLHARKEIAKERIVLRTYIRSDVEDLRITTKTAGRIFDITRL